MGESCKECKTWQSHAYWSHMDPKNVKFFVEMKASFNQYLNLPRKFARNFRGQISETVKLKGPSGKTWRIKVLKSGNTLTLQSGWREFVTANKIEENNLLVFIYRGSSSFDVSIFDSSGCEKAAPFFIKGPKTEMQTESEYESEKTSSDSDTSVRVFIPEEKICSESEISSRVIRPKKTRAQKNGEGTSKPVRMKASGDSSDEVREKISCKRKRNANGMSRFANKKAKQAPSDKYYVIPHKLNLSVAQRKITNEIASATQPGSKLFVKILNPQDMLNYLSIPKYFAIENIGKRSKSISLQLANKKKFGPASYIYKLQRQWISSGWGDFTLEYNLKEGDLCLFELKKLAGARLAFVVHVRPGAN